MRIIVGVDGSAGSRLALRWAVAEASARDCPVVALLAYGFYGRPKPVQDRADGWDEDALGAAAADVLHESVTAVTGGPRGGVSGPPVTTMVAEMEPVDALLDLVTSEDLLVVGSRGLGPVKRLLLGSTSEACTRYSTGAVVVVRSAEEGAQRTAVVVGVDGSAGSVAALRWAVGHARSRRAPLHVVRAWTSAPGVGLRMADVLADSELREQTEKQLHEMVSEHCRDADIPITAELVDGSPTPTLIDAAAEAELLVVGARGADGFARLLLGSTSAACLHHASTSVAVVHPPDDAEGDRRR